MKIITWLHTKPFLDTTNILKEARRMHNMGISNILCLVEDPDVSLLPLAPVKHMGIGIQKSKYYLVC